MAACSVSAWHAVSVYQALFPVGMLLTARVAHILLLQRSSVYRKESGKNRTCIITYIFEVVFTSAALVLLYAARRLFTDDALSAHDTRRLYAAIHLLFALYIFEIIYRPAMRVSLLIHHLATVGLVAITLWLMETNYHINVLRGATSQMLSALTEQLTFVGMLLYRFGHPYAIPVLKFAAVQSLLCKLFFAAACLGITVHHDEPLWYYVVVIGLAVLVPTQIYGSWAVWQVACLAQRRSAAGGAVCTPAASEFVPSKSPSVELAGACV